MTAIILEVELIDPDCEYLKKDVLACEGKPVRRLMETSVPSPGEGEICLIAFPGTVMMNKFLNHTFPKEVCGNWKTKEIVEGVYYRHIFY